MTPREDDGAPGAPRGADRRDVVTALLLFAASLAWFSLTLSHTFEPRDEGYFLAQSARVAQGELPHRDYMDIYGPGAFTLTGWVMSVFDVRILPVRVFLAGVKAMAVATGFLVTRAVVGWPFALFGGLLAMAWWGYPSWNLNTPYASLYTVPLCELALLLAIAAERRRSLPVWLAAGLVAGLSVLFKQSLGAMVTFGIGLAILASGMLCDPPGRRVRLETRLVLAGWALAAVALLLPASFHLGLADYLLHFLPIHALMALVAGCVLRRGGSGALLPILRDRLLPWAAGVILVLAGTAALYARWGALDALWFDMFVIPGLLINYYGAVSLPPAGLALLLLGVAAGIAGALLFIAGRRRAPWALCAAGVALAVLGAIRLPGDLPGVAPERLLLNGARLVQGVQLAALGWAGIAALGWQLRRAAPGPAPPRLRAVLPILFFHLMLCFQIFPRAGVDVLVTLGAQCILLTLLLQDAWSAVARGRAAPLRALAAVLLLLLPLWAVRPAVAGAIRLATSPQNRALDIPGTEGISLQESILRRFRFDDLARVMANLHTQEPADAPLLLLTNYDMIHFLSPREPLFPRQRAYLFWVAWNKLPPSEIARLDDAALARRLAETPQAIVVRTRDPAGERLRAALPKLAAFVDAHYRERARFGVFQVLTRDAGDG